jgi:RNA polymerase sigma-70 factor (ECF subfamily)
VSEQLPASGPDQGAVLLDLYDEALPSVYGYLLPRCGNVQLAEDLTAETFLGAVSAVKRGTVERMSVAWLVGVARHKLVDHWRRRAREDRKLQVAQSEQAATEDPWDAKLDVIRAHEVLAALGAHHRTALTLRYLDGLSVPQVADHLGRTIHATEALLVRARSAFRRAYEEGDGDV